MCVSRLLGVLIGGRRLEMPCEILQIRKECRPLNAEVPEVATQRCLQATRDLSSNTEFGPRRKAIQGQR